MSFDDEDLEGFPSLSNEEQKCPVETTQRRIAVEKDGGEEETRKRDISRPKVKKAREGSFEGLGLCPELVEAVRRQGYRFPTPIQRKVIPEVLSGEDVIAMARTGSGKTAAFLLPILHRLLVGQRRQADGGNSSSTTPSAPFALVLSPTRDLALQTYAFAKKYVPSNSGNIRMTVVVGGEPIEAQFAALSTNPHLIVASPGRLLQVLSEMRGAFELKSVQMTVLDEADRLFESSGGTMREETLEVLRAQGTSALRQTLLISATMPKSLSEFTRTGIRASPTIIRLDTDTMLSPTLSSAFFVVRDEERIPALLFLLRSTLLLNADDNPCSTIIFASTRHHVQFLVSLADLVGIPGVSGVHGSMDQSTRNLTLARFRSRKLNVLIVTDVAARGLDIPVLDLVINFNYPTTPKLFVHRAGRVARGGRAGSVISLVSTEELPFAIDTFLFLGRDIKGATEIVKPVRILSLSARMDLSFLIGRLDRSSLEEEASSFQAVLRNSSELTAEMKTMNNSQKLFRRSRPSPSGHAVRKAKVILEGGGILSLPVHPWVAQSSDGSISQWDPSMELRAWRPKETVVVSNLKIKSENYNGSTPYPAEPRQEEKPLHDVDVPMRRKIRKRDALLEQQKRDFFLPTQPDHRSAIQDRGLATSNGGSMADKVGDLVLDLVGEDDDTMRSQKRRSASNRMQWDRKQKKYVRSESGQRREVSVETRSSGEAFKRWRKQNRGQEWEGHHLTGLGNKDMRKGKARERAMASLNDAKPTEEESRYQPAPKSHTKTQLKSRETILKARKEKAKRRGRNMSKDGARRMYGVNRRGNRK